MTITARTYRLLRRRGYRRAGAALGALRTVVRAAVGLIEGRETLSSLERRLARRRRP